MKTKEESSKRKVKGLKTVMNRRIIKTQPRATVVIRQPHTPDIINDENRFFKSNFNNEKRSMFLE